MGASAERLLVVDDSDDTRYALTSRLLRHLSRARRFDRALPHGMMPPLDDYPVLADVPGLVLTAGDPLREVDPAVAACAGPMCA